MERHLISPSQFRYLIPIIKDASLRCLVGGRCGWSELEISNITPIIHVLILISPHPNSSKDGEIKQGKLTKQLKYLHQLHVFL